ncbi:hypothetical protein [Gloeothece verrucosa]|uniref:REase associating with pPIWI RE domain-containing protein n=1 Tax=Gloeothece verrucosa (strain PCC 7822) TaxID=497965 RepID=E0UG55_GLOV7|nr:hypothetical protein [Gloeothece verrucosa]ADN15556.1 hypothetical protein Cyan7822_3616 [Gloeothece verrucosa PCC 7822]
MQFSKEQILFIKLCKGLVQICDRINRGEPAYLVDASQPFPKPLYEAFQELSLKWILRDGKMRHPSILCMIEAARDKVEAVEPEFIECVDFPDEPLIENMTRPSEECEAWASKYAINLERDQNQSYIPRLIQEIERLSLPYSTYPLFRKFIAENQFPSDFDLTRFGSDNPNIRPVQELVRQAYREAPPQSVSMPLCKTCGGYLDCAARDIEDCCEPLDRRVDRVPTEDTVICLIRPSFLELRLARILEEMGLQVELWPDLDKADLRVKFPTGEVWALDAKDWGSATLLAIELNQDTIPDLGQSQSFFVVPDYRWQKLAYQAAFESRYKNDISVLSESELIKRARGYLNER